MLSACWRSKSRPARFSDGFRGSQLRLGLLGRAFHRGDLAADAVDGGLLGRDLARARHRPRCDNRRRRSGRSRRRCGPRRCRRAGSPRCGRTPGRRAWCCWRAHRRRRWRCRSVRPERNARHSWRRRARAARPTPIRTSLRLPDFGAAGAAGGSRLVDGRAAGASAGRRTAALPTTWERGWSAELRKHRARNRFRRIRLRDEGCVRPGLSLRPSRPPQLQCRDTGAAKNGCSASPDLQISIDRTVRSRYIHFERPYNAIPFRGVSCAGKSFRKS